MAPRRPSDTERESMGERQLRRILEKLPAGAYTCDPTGLITYFNPQAVRLWGREPRLRDPVDRYCGSFRLFASDGSPIAHEDCWMARALRDGRDCDGEEIVIERPDGTRVAALAHATPLRDEAGRLVGSVNVLVNVTDRRQTEAALRESEQRFAKFMQHLPGLAWIKDLEGRYVFANEAAERAFQRTRADLLGRTDDEIFPADTARQFRENDAKALTCGAGVEVVEVLEHRDGIHHSLVSKFPILDSDGRPALIGGMAIDITERRLAENALRESEARFRHMADNAPVLIWVNDLDGCEFVNREYLRFLGCTIDAVRGTGWQRFVHPEDADAYLAAYQRAIEEQATFEAELRFRRADGEYRWLRSTGVPRRVDDGGLVGFVGCSVDITDIKRSERALRAADRRKDEFLATLAHELRNPLAPIRNGLQLLRQEGVAPAARDALEMMDRQVDHIVRLVDDLLEVSRITRGKIELRRERVELASVVSSALEAARPRIEARHHRLVVSLPAERVVLDADAVRLAQVLANVLHNAAKYTDDGGTIRLSARREGDGAVVSVRDDGVGIPADALARVFEPFTQSGHTLGREQGGLGIGLSLVKRLVELHGGRVEARSEGPGRGSEIVVTLPVASTEPAGAVEIPRSARRPATLHGRRVLVVDDNRDAADSLGILMRRCGAEVNVAYDGRSALDTIAAFRPSTVLLDLGMPGIDGCEVARRIRQQPDLDGIVLIALTGWGQATARARSREAGFDHHLVKPVAIEVLEELLARDPVAPPQG